MTTASDDAIWEYAKTGSFTILSKDSDFMHRSLLHGHPPKVVQLLCGNCATAKIVAILLRDQSVLDDFIRDPTESLLILKQATCR